MALVLGSGLGGFADRLQEAVPIPYGEIRGMPRSAVPGHRGRLVLGRIGEMPLVVMQGRVHLYEGHDAEEVVFGARLMVHLGAETVVLTNAAGGIRSDMRAGDLMVIDDHLNLTGHTCLLGRRAAELGDRFVDMSHAYDPDLRAHADATARELQLELKHGVYAGMLGPSYETPAEIGMLRTLGADAVGMSTVLETIAARHMGARCLGISCITNVAAGLTSQKLDHEDVQAQAARASERFERLLQRFLDTFPGQGGDA